MKTLSVIVLVFLLFFMSSSISAQSLNSDHDILAQRGAGIVTQADFTARADKIPPSDRHTALRDTGRLQSVLTTLLLRAQLAADAREAGYDKTTVIKNRMKLAADAELGNAWLQHYLEIQPAGDYETLAQEYYQLNKQDILSSEKIDVSHILISSKERTLEEASELADDLSEQIKGNPSLFDELIMTNSDDPSKTTNNGSFFGINKGDMVSAFDEKAFSMQKGEISLPVETVYGFHIIRLDEHYAPAPMSFEAVKDSLITSERKKHEDRIKQQYLSGLTSLDVRMSKEALEEMVNRQFENTDIESADNGAE